MMMFKCRAVIIAADNSTDYNRKRTTILPVVGPHEDLLSNPHAIIYGYIL